VARINSEIEILKFMKTLIMVSLKKNKKIKEFFKDGIKPK